MKKLIPILTIAGVSILVASGCESTLTEVKEPYISNIESFQNDINNYSKVNNSSVKTFLNKYNVSITDPNIELLNDTELNEISNSDYLNSNLNSTDNESVLENSNNSEIFTETENDNLPMENEDEIIDETINGLEGNEDLEENNENNSKTQISTLYSLSQDINDSCDQFCQLKNEITNAIIETQNLIEKVKNNEITLTAEQKMFITEQSRQLKNLGRQLSTATTELSLNLSDISTIFTNKDGTIDNLSMKYLLVLDNLVNGNEMLENSLQSLNMINSLFLANGTLPPNNTGRIVYGFRHNNEPPVIRDYKIENGQIIENNTEENNENNNEAIQTTDTDSENTVIDSYKNNRFKSNIDTYGNTNSNIDSFFNTAWLDNDFMYGNNNGYGYPMQPYGNGMGLRNGYYPYIENNKNAETVNNTTSSVNNDNTTQEKQKKEKRKIKLQKNIDTYRDENTPTVSAKLTVIKDSINGFFNKFKSDENLNEVREKIKD